jgi:hypothetical protein
VPPQKNCTQTPTNDTLIRSNGGFRCRHGLSGLASGGPIMDIQRSKRSRLRVSVRPQGYLRREHGGVSP